MLAGKRGCCVVAHGSESKLKFVWLQKMESIKIGFLGSEEE